MNEKKIVKNLNEGDGEFVVADENGEKTSYYLNFSRPLDVDVDELQISRHLSIDDNTKQPRIGTKIIGKARPLAKFISVIGDPNLKAKSVSISFYVPSERDLSIIAENNALYGIDSGSTPATMSLVRSGYSYQKKDVIWIYCLVTEDILSKLVDSIERQSIDSLKICFEFKGLYTTDQHSDWDYPVEWYLRPNKLDNSIEIPNNGFGRLRWFSLDLQKSDLRKDDSNTPDTTPEIPNPLAEGFQQVSAKLLALLSEVGSTRKNLTAIFWIMVVYTIMRLFKR